MRLIRQLHLHFGIFFAPAILLFSLSGALQTFEWHASDDDGKYTAAPWIRNIAAIHMDQRLAGPLKAVPQVVEPTTADSHITGSELKQAPPHSSFPLKCFVFLMSIGLVFSTFTGIYMALKMRNSRPTLLLSLAAGTLMPIVMLFI